MTRQLDAPVALVIDALATYRLVKLVRDDRVTSPVRAAVDSRTEPGSLASYFLDCPWCLSMWFGAGLTLARRRWPGATSVVARPLALSALAGLATTRLEP